MKIITLTLSPAFDMHCYAENFKPYHENLADITAFDAGGKGVNISRALCFNGVENTAFVVLGRENGGEFTKRLEDDGIAFKALTVEGRIRENITLHTEGAPETRISFKGFSADSKLLSGVEAELDTIVDGDSIVTFTGRVPEGLSMDAVKAFLVRLNAKGAKVVLDSRSFTRQDMIDVSPWLIKPNEEEIFVYSGKKIEDFESAADAAEELRLSGIENVMISLGGKGAVLSTSDGVYAATVPDITVVSTIGAGDSSIAGFMAAITKGLGYGDALANAMAYGNGACMTEGTRPPSPEAVAELLGRIGIEKIR